MRPSGEMGGEEREEKRGKAVKNGCNRRRREWEEEIGKKGNWRRNRRADIGVQGSKGKNVRE